MVDVVRFGNDNYKKCCGNCKWYQKCNYMCTNPDKYDFKTNYFSNRKYYRKAYVPSDYGCKHFSFVPNTVYDKKDIEVKVVDAAILDGDKYILFSLAICNHMTKKGESMIIQKDDSCLICKRCKAKFIIKEED